MNNGRCLELCLRFITGIHKRDYESEQEHGRKDKLSRLGLERGRDIYYQTKPVGKTYIAIYKTKRNTSHAVVIENGDIICNPSCISDLIDTTGFINLQKRKEYETKWCGRDPFPPRKR